MEFSAETFLPSRALAQLTELRIQEPGAAMQAAQARTVRQRLTQDGRLSILAADHPARRVTAVGNQPLAMTNRHDYLARILRVLTSEYVDGVMATMDILEDLLVLDAIVQQEGGPSALNEKLLIASLNRGGLAGAVWEMNDPITGPGPATCAAWRLDGAKMLLRVCDDEPDSLATMREAALAISELNRLSLPMFLEPLPVVKTIDGYKVVKTAEALARLVGVASALGDSSRYLWLKLPYCEGYECVARATTLPVLLLGGESAGSAEPFLRQLSAALAAAPNVRGALVGRNILYPGAADPRAVADAVGGLIHAGWSIEEGLEAQAARAGRDMDRFARWL